MRRGVGAALGVATLGAAGAAGAASLLVAGAPVWAAPASSPPPIEVHLTLDAHRVVAGRPITGRLTLTNTGRSSITVNTCAANGWIGIGLRGPVDSDPQFGLAAHCTPTVRLAPGANRFAVTVKTSYASCQQERASGVPDCIVSDSPKRPQPLPTGRYTTTVHLVGLAGLTRAPNRIVVTLYESRDAGYAGSG